MLKKLLQKWRDKNDYRFTEGKNLSEVTYKILQKLSNRQEWFIHQFRFSADIYGEPNATTLLPGRGNNPFATIAETVWTFAGRNDSASLTKWFPGAVNLFAYGPRLRHWRTYSNSFFDQVEMLLFRLKKNKNPAIITLWNPAFDGDEKSKDFANNIAVQFFIRDRALNVCVTTHETDIIYDTTIQVFEWCFLGHYLADQLGIPFQHYYQNNVSIYSKNDSDQILCHEYIEPPYLRTESFLSPNFSLKEKTICSPENLRLMCDKIYDAAIKDRLGFITNEFVNSLPYRLADFAWALVAESFLNTTGQQYLAALSKIKYVPLLLSLLDIGMRRRKEALWLCSGFTELWASTDEEIIAGRYLKRLHTLNSYEN